MCVNVSVFVCIFVFAIICMCVHVYLLVRMYVCLLYRLRSNFFRLSSLIKEIHQWRINEDSYFVYRIIIMARAISSNVSVVIKPVAESEIRQHFMAIRDETVIRIF